MKQFFKFLFASMLGFILGVVVLFFLFIFIVSAAVSSMGTEEVKVSSGSVLQINFSQPIRDRSSNNPFEGLNFSTLKSNKQIGMNDILRMATSRGLVDKVRFVLFDIPEGQLHASEEAVAGASIIAKERGSQAMIDLFTQYASLH